MDFQNEEQQILNEFLIKTHFQMLRGRYTRASVYQIYEARYSKYCIMKAVVKVAQSVFY